jgi:large subunit ribosomal protein L24
MPTNRARKGQLKTGDRVLVISGAHRGSIGSITRFNKDRSRVWVEGVNKVKRHERPMPQLGRQGGIVEKEASIHVSNVSLLTADDQPTRVGFKFLDNGDKVRFAKKTGEQI